MKAVQTALLAIATAVVTTQAGVVFQQDFSLSTVLGDYLLEPVGTANFHDIGATAVDGAVATNHSMLLRMPMNSVTPNTAGFFRGSMGNGSTGLMTFQVDFTPWRSYTVNKWNPWGGMTFGDYADTSSYTTYQHLNGTFSGVEFREGGSKVIIRGAGSADTLVDYHKTYRLTVFMNDSGVAQQYLGPDGQVYDLSVTEATAVIASTGLTGTYIRGSIAIWVSDYSNPSAPVHIAVADNRAANTYLHSGTHYDTKVLDTVLASWSGRKDTGDIGIEFDNFVVSDSLPPLPPKGTLISVQ